MDVDSADGPPDGVRQLKKRLPSPLMATSLLEPHERALQFTHRFRLTSHSRLDFSGNSGYETDRGRKVGGTRSRVAQKKGAWPPCCGVVSMAEFSAVGVTDQCPRVIAAGCRATRPPFGFVELALITRLITCLVNRIVAIFQNDL